MFCVHARNMLFQIRHDDYAVFSPFYADIFYYSHVIFLYVAARRYAMLPLPP